jgi:hypothetical protein
MGWPVAHGISAAFSGPSQAMFIQLHGETFGKYLHQTSKAAQSAAEDEGGAT